MKDKIKQSYRTSKSIYDDVLTRGTWWSRLYMNVFWGGCDDNEIARKVLAYIPDDFQGRLLDVPVGTAVFTYQKYARMKNADITCVDYSGDMLEQASSRFTDNHIPNVMTMKGDVEALPFDDERFDIVLSMNGFHAFPDKEKAYSEVNRVLRKGGKGWFTPPFETPDQLRVRLESGYDLKEFHLDRSIVYFLAEKK